MLEVKLAAVETRKAHALEAAVASAEKNLKRAPIRDAPCAAERLAVATCYKQEKEALKCQDAVTAYSACSSGSAEHLLGGR